MGYVVLHIEKAAGTDAAMSGHVERRITPANVITTLTYLNQELIEFPKDVTNRTEAIQHRLDNAGLESAQFESRILVETVLELRKGAPSTCLLDLCSGSGCIPAAVSAHLPDVTGAVLELSPDALPYLRQNLHRHAPQLQCCAGDVLCPPAALLEQQYHIITCNPPYLTAADMEQLQPEVAHEPETALFGGTDGLDFYRKLTMLWKPALLPGGWLVYEVGAGQAADVEQIFRKNGYAQVHTVPDLTGIGRVVLGQKAEI